MEQKMTATPGEITAHASNPTAKVQKNSRPTKISRILAHLESGRSITPLMALRLYHSFCLKDIICDLRRRGYDITTEVVEDAETGAKFGRYTLNQDCHG